MPYQAAHVSVCAWHAPAGVNDYVAWGPMLHPVLGRERVQEIYDATPPAFRDPVVETYTLRPAQDWPTTAGSAFWRERGAAPPVELRWDWIPGARAVVPEVGFGQAAHFERDWS